MPVERVVGIDFGTSSSVIKTKTYADGKPMGETVGADYIRFNNRDFVPTLVYTAHDGSVLFGFEAANASVPGHLRFNFKLDLISEDESARDNAMRLTTQFFVYLYKVYSEQTPKMPACDIETTIVSYPAKWPQSLREGMIALANEAGFKNVIGLDEPSAAVKSVIVHDEKSIKLNACASANILVVDMGAGTTDLVLCRYAPGVDVSIVNIWPKGDKGALLGGREVDEALCEYVKEYLVNCGLPGSRDFRSKYIDKCKAWKETNVSPVLAKPDGIVRYCGFAESIVAMIGTDAEFPPLKRDNFEGMLDTYIARLPRMVNDCLDDAGFNGADVDCVILTGGHSRWYFAEEILTGKITKYGRVNLTKIEADKTRVVRTPNPQETVALGLVYQKLTYKQPQANARQADEGTIYCGKCGAKNYATGTYCTKCASTLYNPDYIASETVCAMPQAAINSGKAEMYALRQGKTIAGIASAIEALLATLNMNVQTIESNDSGFVVQARDKAGTWKQFIGMDVAISVIVRQADANTASIEFTQAKWVDKGGVFALSMFVFWPLAITSGIGMYMQGKLPGEVKKAVVEYVNSSG